MGKILIIKGADFSAVAVGTETIEPSDYVTIEGYGVAGDFITTGTYFLNSSANGLLYVKTASGADPAELPSGTVLKYRGFYFKVLSDSPFFQPYYNCEPVELISGSNDKSGYYKIVDGAFVYQNEGSWRCSIIPVASGQTLIYKNRGGNAPKTLAVIDGSNAITTIDDSKTSYDIRTWVNNTGGAVTAYLNYQNTDRSYIFFGLSKL